jgi:urease accessory protein
MRIDSPGPPTPVAERQRLRVEGGARLRLRDDSGITRLADLWHHDPMRVLLPAPVDDCVPHAVLLNTAGGLVAGDRLDIAVRLDADSGALVTGQAAEKVYRSDGPAVTIETSLSIASGAAIEWMPQETILFEGSRLHRRLRIDLEPGARCVAGEMLVFGRRAHGERIRTAELRERWEIRMAGRLVWADALGLDAAHAEARLAAPFGFSGAAAAATLVYAGSDAARLHGPVAEAIAGLPGIGATCLGDLLLIRGLGPETQSLRRSVASAWRVLRALALGRPALLPRLWHV